MSHFWNIMFKIHPKRRRMQNDFFVQGIFILGCYHQKNNVSSSSRFNDVVRFLSTFACVSLSRMEITKKVKSFFGEATYFYFFSFYVLMSLDIKCVVFNGNIFLIRFLWAYWWHERLISSCGSDTFLFANMQADISTLSTKESHTIWK